MHSIYKYKRLFVRNFSALAVAIALFTVGFAASVSAQAGWVAEKRVTTGDLVSVYFLNSDRGWVGGDDGYFATTIDGGRNWTKQSLKTTSSINDIYFRNEQNGYALAGGQVFITNNGGQNWMEAPALNKADFRGIDAEFYSIRFSDKKRGWIVGSLSRGDSVVDSLVLRTTDSGSSWQRVRVPTTEELFHIEFINEQKGWIVGTHGIILFTEDAGSSWQRQKSDVTTDLNYVDFRGSKDGWAVGAKGVILHTDDGGRNWYKMGANIHGPLLRVAFMNDKDGFIVGRNGLILRSNDGGRSWIKQDSKVTDHLYGLFVDKKAIWAVGSKGALLRYERQ